MDDQVVVRASLQAMEARLEYISKEFERLRLLIDNLLEVLDGRNVE